MKKQFLLTVLLLLFLLLAVSCTRPSDSTAGTESPAVESTEAPFATSTTDLTTATTDPPVTTPPVTTEADTTYEDVFYDLSPIEGEAGEPLTVNWNPYRLSPLLAEDEELKSGAEALIKAIINRRLSVSFSSREVMLAVVDNMFYEFPPSALCTFSPDGEGATLRISYSLNREEHLQAMADFGDKVEDLIAETLIFGDGEAEKALLLYHKVVDVVDYFTVTYAPWQTNGYYALMGGRSICYGFADAYNYLLRQVGIDAYLVKGYRAADKAAHGWSLVKIDGVYYHCDPTWENSMFDGAGFWYFGNVDERRGKALALSAATVGEGSLKMAIPCAVTDTRFSALYQKSITRAEWQIDREKQVIVYDGKQYSYKKS